MSEPKIPATPPTGVRMAPHLPANNTFMSYRGTPVFRHRIFSDINHKNFAGLDPAHVAAHEEKGEWPGLYVHLENVTTQVHKAALERKYGMKTEYVEELQLKWQQLKASNAKDLIIPNPAHPSPDGTPRFDPLVPDPAVWNSFYIDRRDAIMSEIFIKCLADKVAFQFLMEAVLPFWQARRQNQRVHKADGTVKKNIALMVANEQLMTECYSQIFDYLELILQYTPDTEPVPNANMSPEDLAAFSVLQQMMGQQALTYAQAFRYMGQLYISWLENVCRNNKPSPSSGSQHLIVARDIIKSLRDFPRFTPAETFGERFDLYRNMTLRFADWMRIKFSREDYLLRLRYAHDVVMSSLPDELPTIRDRDALMRIEGLGDEYVQILCVVWSRLGIRPQPWMMHFSYAEEDIRQAALERAAAGGGGQAQNVALGGSSRSPPILPSPVGRSGQ